MPYPMTRAILAGCAAFTAAAASAGPTHYPRGDDLPFAESVQAGDVLYLSGILADSDGGGVVPGGIEPETRAVMAKLGQTLARHGLGFADLIQCTAMLTDMKEWPAFNAVYRTSFKPGHFPARAAMGVTALARGARIELQCSAWNPARKAAQKRR